MLCAWISSFKTQLKRGISHKQASADSKNYFIIQDYLKIDIYVVIDI